MSRTTLLVDDVRIPARDGALLAADVIRRDDDEPHPVLLLRGPYSRAGARSQLDLTGLTAAGWALVIGDVRGRGQSEGDATPFVHEAADGHDTLEWITRQPWCDGRVAGQGTSYLGYAQWHAAGTGHPALKAVAAVQAAADPRPGLCYEGGAPLAANAAYFGAAMAMSDQSLPGEVRARALELAGNPVDLVARPGGDPLAELYPPYAAWRAGAGSEYWAPTVVSPQTHRMDVPGYHVAGWYDIFCEAGIELWRQLRERAAGGYARVSQRLVVGFWGHGMMLQALGELDFGPTSDVATSGAFGAMHPWLRRAVDREPVESGASVFVMGVNRWLELPDWPPPSEPLTLHLGQGTLGTAAAADGVDAFDHDPSDPVPTRGGRMIGHWQPLPGPYDQRHVEARPDVLVYTSPELASALTVAGTVTLVVQFTSTAASADVTAKLVDVHPDGRAFNIVDGVQRCSPTPGEPAQVEVRLGSVAHAFAAGHRVRLEIASSNFPRVEINASPARQQVLRGGGRLSALVLPVIGNLDGAARARFVEPAEGS